MKPTILYSTIFISLLFLIGCKKESSTPDDSSGTVTAVGTPIGIPITKTIGVEGGRIESSDEKMQIIIPQGAVSSAVTFSVQPVSNNAPNGIGLAYQLLPEGIHFNKPVTLLFHYNDPNNNGNAADHFFVAYQTNKNTWKSYVHPQVDETNQTVSIQTNHFTVWAMFDRIKLLIVPQQLKGGETANLQVVDVFKFALMSDWVELVDEPVNLGGNVDVDKWSLITKVGQLDGRKTNALYAAPSKITKRTEVEIDASIKFHSYTFGNSHLILIGHVILLPDDNTPDPSNPFIDVSFDNPNPNLPKSTYHFDETIVTFDKDQTIIEGTDLKKNASITVSVTGNEAKSYPFIYLPKNQLSNYVTITSIPENINVSTYYIDCNNIDYASTSGNITFTQFDAEHKWILGNISGSITKTVLENQSCSPPQLSIAGSFAVIHP